MYRYFSFKEETFLNIFGDLFEGWYEDCSQRLQKLKQNVEIDHFAETWVASYMPHPQFLNLPPCFLCLLKTIALMSNCWNSSAYQ